MLSQTLVLGNNYQPTSTANLCCWPACCPGTSASALHPARPPPLVGWQTLVRLVTRTPLHTAAQKMATQASLFNRRGTTRTPHHTAAQMEEGHTNRRGTDIPHHTAAQTEEGNCLIGLRLAARLAGAAHTEHSWIRNGSKRVARTALALGPALAAAPSCTYVHPHFPVHSAIPAYS